MTIPYFLDVNSTIFNIWGYQISYLEFFGTIFNMWCVWFAAKNKISNWVIGLVGIFLYIFLFYQIQLYSDLIEQIYFLIMSFYGWWLWTKIKRDGNKKKQKDSGMKFNSKKGNLISLAIIIIGTILLTSLTTKLNIIFPNIFPKAATYPLLDAFTTVMSFVATILLARKIVEAWYLWIVVDIIGVWLYYVKGVKFISLEYLIFLVMASYGLYDWFKKARAERKDILVDS